MVNKLEQELEEMLEIIESGKGTEVNELVFLNTLKQYRGDKKREYYFRFKEYKRW